MLSGEKILITGPAGQIAFPMTEFLARDNEVWGIARFTEPGSRERVEAVGATTRVIDLADGDYSDLPDDFTYVVHMATFQGQGLDYDWAIKVNAEGTGLLLAHCRKAKAALVASTFSTYKPNRADQGHLYKETDPLGDANMPQSATYSISKITEEAVARTCARLFDLPITLGRINASYSSNGGLPTYHLDWQIAGAPVMLRAPGHTPYSPIHQDDMNEQVEKLLAVASVPGTIVNWAGDDVVTPEEWCEYYTELSGVVPQLEYREFANSNIGSASDNTRRTELIGPCRVPWREGLARVYHDRYPEGPDGPKPGGQSSNLLSAYQAD
jgi:nucleoside-diphosphate-sugar epimerase